MKSLLERDLVRIVGRRDAPGRPALYGTSATFLETFGLRGLTDLPRAARDRGDRRGAVRGDLARRRRAPVGEPEPTPGDAVGGAVSSPSVAELQLH